jgi:hypothetical protein
VLRKSPPQCLSARQQTAVRVREREQWEEREGLLATGTATATDSNPVVMLIVGLLAPAPVADISVLPHKIEDDWARDCEKVILTRKLFGSRNLLLGNGSPGLCVTFNFHGDGDPGQSSVQYRKCQISKMPVVMLLEPM